MVHVARDAPVELSIATDRLPLTAADPARVADLAGAYGVTSSIARLQKALDGLPDWSLPGWGPSLGSRGPGANIFSSCSSLRPPPVHPIAPRHR